MKPKWLKEIDKLTEGMTGPIQPPGAKECPKCERYYLKALQQNHGGRIILVCPYCGKPLR